MSTDSPTYIHTPPNETMPLVTPETRRFSIQPLDHEFYSQKQESMWSKCKSQFGQFLKVCGPGFVVAIGYMDPGNWATDLVILEFKYFYFQ
jgi:hypothetical protein